MSATIDQRFADPQPVASRRYNAARDLMERNLSAGRGSKTVYIDDDGAYDYDELNRRVAAFSAGLAALRVQPEQRVVLCLLDGIDFPTAFLGCIRAGVIPVAINTSLSADGIGYVLSDSRAVALIVSEALLQPLAATIAQTRSLQHVIVSGKDPAAALSMQTLLGSAAPSMPYADTMCDEACFWLYSSGSTGLPKGTVHAHSSLIQTAQLYAEPIAGYRESDIVFSVSKLPFAYGLGNSLTFPLAVGATAILMAERPTPAAVARRLIEHRPTVFCSVPTAYAALLASADLPEREGMRMRVCVSAGEALPEEIGRRWRQHFGLDILDGIGSTEMLHIFLSNTPAQVRYGTTGIPVPGYEVRIVDEEGRAVPAGESGELQIRGPSRAIAYWNDRARSGSTFLGEWVRSGDNYRQREDGCYVFEGRNDDMLKVNGLYVSPIEVESALIEHAAVQEVAVVARRDAAGFDKPCAFVVLVPGGQAAPEELQQQVKNRLAPYKCPRWIEFVAELPKTPTGKIQRFRLRERAAQL